MISTQPLAAVEESAPPLVRPDLVRIVVIIVSDGRFP